MGVVYDYFTAASDEEAAAAINDLRAPSGGRELVADTGIDPAVQLGTLEELLTGRSYDSIEEDPRNGDVLADRDGGEILILTVTDALLEALAEATPDTLREVSVPWSQTEEFWGAVEPEELAETLTDLASLARSARERGRRVYCWASV